MSFPIFKLPSVAFNCVVQQFDQFDVIRLCINFKPFADVLAQWRIFVDVFQFIIAEDKCIARWNGLEFWICLECRHKENKVTLESTIDRKKCIDLKVSEELEPLEKMEEILDKIFPVLNIQHLDFHFNGTVPIEIEKVFIWRKFKKFRNIDFTPCLWLPIKLPSEVVHFSQEEIQVDTLTLNVLGTVPDFWHQKLFKVQKVVLVVAFYKLKHILNWTSPEVEIKYFQDVFSSSHHQVREFLKSWLVSENITLKRVSVPINCYKKEIPDAFLYIDKSEILEEREVFDSERRPKVVEKILRRQRDGMKAKATVTHNSFKFEVLEMEE